MLRRMLIAATLTAFSAPGVANAQNPVLRAEVGPGFEIRLRDAAGAAVTSIAAGTYDVVVEDKSDIHNFHLSGPGVNRSTTVAGTGTETWTVTLGDGVYTFQCDPHRTELRGQFSVGTGVPPPPPPPPPPGGGSAKRLVATVGPGFTIGLARSGRKVRRLPPGRYTIVVRDRAAIHNFHLAGPRLNRRSGVGSKGTRTWTVTLRKGTYRYWCDPHRATMRGSFRVA